MPDLLNLHLTNRIIYSTKEFGFVNIGAIILVLVNLATESQINLFLASQRTLTARAVV